jgi:hypothetical protein
MTSGIFSAVFASNLQIGGCGVAIFQGNTIHGGDASHYYLGKYRFDDSNQISGTIDVVKYSTLQDSIFGPLAPFRLILNGHIITNDRAFELSGHAEGRPQLQIRIALNKLEELIEA